MFKHYLHKVRALPPQVIAQKIAGRIKQKGFEALMRQKDRNDCSYAAQFHDGDFFLYFPRLLLRGFLPQTEMFAGITRHYLDHRFDLLGSGRVQVYHGMSCRGLEGYRYDMGKTIQADPEGEWLNGRINPANVSESRRIWRLTFQEQSGANKSDRGGGYIPID